MTSKDLLLFTTRLSMLLHSGITIPQALVSLSVDGTKSLSQSLLKHIDSGQTFAQSLASHGGFSKYYISLVAVGETSGNLEANLNHLVGELQKDYDLRQKIHGALVYPIFVLILGLIIAAGIFIFVLPKLLSIFDSFSTDLPSITQDLIFISGLVHLYWVYALGALSALLLVAVIFTQAPGTKHLWHYILLHVPFVGKLVALSELARFCRNLGTLLHSGIPIADSLEIVAASQSNLVFASGARRISSYLTAGHSLGEAFTQLHLLAFPAVVAQMTSTADLSGKTDEALLYLADFFESETANYTKNFTALVEPVLIIVIGFLVALLAIVVFGPIYQILGNLQK